jgi:hypothetical protein
MKSSPALVQATTQSSPRAIIDPFSTRSVENFEAKLAKIPSDLSKRKQFRQLQPSHGLMQRLTQLRVGWLGTSLDSTTIMLRHVDWPHKGKEQTPKRRISQPSRYRIIQVPMVRPDCLPGCLTRFTHRLPATLHCMRTHIPSELLVFRVDRSRRLKFISASRHPSTLPPASIDAREVAFAGRSNVGKSSLVNRLTKSSPAVAENKPGVTQVCQASVLNCSNACG